jgi:hypothetical protein
MQAMKVMALTAHRVDLVPTNHQAVVIVYYARKGVTLIQQALLLVFHVVPAGYMPIPPIIVPLDQQLTQHNVHVPPATLYQIALLAPLVPQDIIRHNVLVPVPTLVNLVHQDNTRHNMLLLLVHCVIEASTTQEHQLQRVHPVAQGNIHLH